MDADEIREIRRRQDLDWESGHSAGWEGRPRVVPDGIRWPGDWHQGYNAGAEDKAKQTPTTPGV